MECITPTFDVNLDPNGLVVDLDGLYAWLARLRDKGHTRGVLYAPVTVLLFMVLAKLAGPDRLYGISQWLRYRKEPLAQAFHSKKPRAPCANTCRSILGRVIDIAEFEQVGREFFASQPNAGQSIVIALDGKTLHGTISAGQTRGQHLLAADLPAERGAIPDRSG